MTAFDTYLHTVIDQGTREAREDGSAAVEAHHLLLAIAAERETTTLGVLTSVGLDHQAIRDALDREFEHSLGAAGVSLAAFGLPRPSVDPGRSTQLGASARLALERGFSSVTRKKDLRPAHLLLGIVRAQVGTVPRALALAGVDQADLTTRVLQTLTPEDD
ncbi:Clp protease N-terminal domain-containing protein [Sphaerisporangium corydalis]|uniref:Clp protease N-terminal domain-containing protein n=1 Tax=Sphaerisporangium corydalis TaxID=1441875 RepID=A0ABV9EPX2_9ACTN|nr:Clp protease N-terminal domain-containing protein [Sphaerisporangium corydalis]